jgi:hypothetical protein
MSKKATRKTNDGPHVFWRNGRAYADLRAYADVGGDKSPLALPGATWGTTDQQIAEALFAAKLADLQAKRAGRVGIVERRTTLRTRVYQHRSQAIRRCAVTQFTVAIIAPGIGSPARSSDPHRVVTTR